MNTCPTCHRTYDNETKFCLEDGSLLKGDTASGTTVSSNADQTLRLPGHATEQPRSVPLPPAAPAGSQGSNATVPTQSGWILVLVIAFIIAGAGIVVALIVMRGPRYDSSSPPVEATASPAEEQRNADAGSASAIPRPPSVKSPSPTQHIEPKAGPPLTGVATEQPSVPPSEPRAPISGGVLNGKAIRLVQPSYPAIAKAAHASGSVTVQVLIDENGNVTSAHAVSGHALLQASAVSAARASKFTPTKLSGQPVKVSGVIIYNFVAQ